MSNIIVRQANDLIEASYKIASIGEARLVRLLIGQISPFDEDFKTYHISVSDFANAFELNARSGNVYEMIEEAAEGLIKRIITIKDGKSWYKASWLSSAKYIHGSGVVELRFDKDLKPYLLQLKGYYADYKLENITYFKSNYSIRLFELLVMEAFKADANGYFKRSFEYEELRGKVGVEEGEYPFFKDFRVRVIETAKKEISRFSCLNIIQVDYAKTGRKVTHIVFHVEKQKQGSIVLEGGSPQLIEKPEEAKEHEYTDDIRELIAFGIDEATAYKWRKKYGVKKIARNMAYTRAMQKAGKIRDSVTGYLARAIAEDIASGWEQEQKAKIEKQQAEKDKERAKQQQEEYKLAQEREERNNILDEFHALPDNEQGAIRRKYEDGLAPILRTFWERAKKDNPETPENDIKTIVGFVGFYKTYKANLQLPV